MSNGTVAPKCKNKAPRFSSSSFRNELIDGNESMGKFNDNVILIIYKQLLQVQFAFHNYKVCPTGKKVNRNRINKCIFNLINSSMTNKINRISVLLRRDVGMRSLVIILNGGYSKQGAPEVVLMLPAPQPSGALDFWPRLKSSCLLQFIDEYKMSYQIYPDLCKMRHQNRR